MAEELWAGVAEAYARSFAGLCEGTTAALVDDLTLGARVLDVGCGTGTLLAAAGKRGVAGIGVDPDPEMVALAGERCEADIRLAGLPELPFENDAFDVVIANFVLNHVDDPQAAARELRRVTAPEGELHATIWGSTPPPQAVMWNGLLDEVGAVRPAMPRLPADRDFERSPRGLAGLLESAGMRVTSARTYGWIWSPTPEDLWAGLSAVGNFGVLWRAQAPAVQQRLRAAYDALGEPWLRDGRFAFDVECVLVQARGDGRDHGHPRS